MTLPTPDAQSPKFLSQQPHSNPPTHSMPFTPPSTPPHPAYPFTPSTPSTPAGHATEPSEINARRRVTDFAGNSWDLATGGLKTLTAKRELPPRLERRSSEKLPDETAAQRSFTFALVILACIVVMLVGGGIVLFVMLQP
ncbi:MAG: hypothetical protein NVS3B14_11560 [Ktedonobacteraceae bacterium]